MSQMGLQMPGARTVRRPQLNVYTALAFAAVVILAIATGLVWTASARLSPESGVMAPFAVQDENNIRFGS
jgi:hypothetical protein